MRVIVVVAALLLWVSPTLAEQKAPDGFGPIKLGMTKEEAWEAIGGEGEWTEHEGFDELSYEVDLQAPSSSATIPATVHHFFQEQRATFAYLETLLGVSGEQCAGWSAQHAALINSLFGAAPLKDSGSYDRPPLTVYTSYVFGFDNGVTLIVASYLEPAKDVPAGGGLCELNIQFMPPNPIVEFF